jgi:hypothetical protein
MKYFIVALVVSLCWLHQDWVLWPLLSEFQMEHDLVFGIPAGLGFQVVLSFATAAVWFLAVWKAWPTELENWASAGDRGSGRSSRGGRGSRDGRGGGRGGNDNRRDRGRSRSSDSQRGDRSSSDRTGEDSDRPRRRRGGRGGRGRGRRSGGGDSNPSSTQ